MRKIFFLLLCCFSFLEAGNLNIVKNAIAKEFYNNFPQIVIQKITIKNTNLPKDFKDYEFLRLGKTKFNKAQGFVRAEFKTPKNIQKNVFFRYFIQANLEVLKANHAIKRGQILELSDYKRVYIDFDKVPLNALNADDAIGLITKTNITRNAILKENMFKIKTLIRKNDVIVGILRDGNVDISIELDALESGNLKDRIRAKNKEGKVVQGIVIGKNRILLQ